MLFSIPGMLFSPGLAHSFTTTTSSGLGSNVTIRGLSLTTLFKINILLHPKYTQTHTHTHTHDPLYSYACPPLTFCMLFAVTIPTLHVYILVPQGQALLSLLFLAAFPNLGTGLVTL